MTTSVWSAGAKWGPSSNTMVWAPSGATPSGKPVPGVAIGGSSINNQIQSASWALGPSDPFADLTPSDASFTFIGQLTAEPDDDMVVATGWGPMWGGRVVSVSETLGVDGLYHTTVSATDKVGQMGGAALRKNNGKTGDLVEIVRYLSRVAGVRVRATDVSVGTYGLPSLQRIAYFGGTTFTGSMLEYLNIAARSSNAMVALQPDGSLRVMTREALPSPPTTVTLSGDSSPSSWTKTLAWGNDVNRWSFANPDGTDLPDVSIPADILAHGERAFSVDNFLDVDTGTGVALNFLDWWGYTPAARWVVTDGQFVVSDLAQEELLTLAPLDWITVEGEDWQVMSMQWTIDGPGQPMRLTITADDFLATMSPAGDGLTISNIEASVSDTSVTVTWDLSDYGQGWIEYGTTLAYGSETAHETSYDYDAHVQSISGLAAGTLYHYRIHAIGPESDPVETVSGDQTFTTESIPETTTPITYVAINSDAMPGYLSTITDSTWGTQIIRVSNTAGYAAGYSKQMAWNKGQTRLFLGQGFRMLDASTYADLGNSHRPFGAEFPVWSNVYADRMYGCADGVGKLRIWDTDTLAWSTLADFSLNTISGQARAYNHCSLGNYEGNISNDDHLIALVCNTLANQSGQWDVIAYDPIDNVVRGTLANVGGNVDNCGVSQSGDYVYVNGTADGSGTYQGLRLYNADMTLVRQVVTYRPHLDMGYDSSGNEVLVNAQAGNMHQLDDGTTTDIFPSGAVAVDGGHVSCRNIDQPGWAYLSDSQSANAGEAGYGQIVAVRLDGSGDVRIYGCHHEVSDLSDNGNYAVPSRDGSKVVFASRWGGSSVYGFVAGVTV